MLGRALARTARRCLVLVPLLAGLTFPQAALADGFAPDIISSDVTRKTLFSDFVFSLPFIMMKFLNLGIALADRENLEAALVEFTEAVRLAPGSASAHYNRGRVLKDLGRLQDAVDKIIESVKGRDLTSAR